MRMYPLVEMMKIRKRGNYFWGTIFYSDDEKFFDLLESVIGYDKILEITDNGYVPF